MLLTKLLTRGTPLIVASMFLHIGVAAALVVGTAGHHAATPVTSLEITVDVTDVAPPTPAPIDEKEPEPAAKVEEEHHHHAALPTHTHPYEVPADHDAHPHDPSLVHTHGAEPAEAAPVVAAAEPAATPVMPTFTIAIGNAKAASGHVATGSDGTGGTNLTNASTSPVDQVVLAESAVSSRATLLSSATAAYPRDARQNEIEADVPVEIVVDAHGAVTTARIVQNAGSGFDESALAAIKRYRFNPAQRDGHAVSVRMRWSVQFRLR